MTRVQSVIGCGSCADIANRLLHDGSEEKSDVDFSRVSGRFDIADLI